MDGKCERYLLFVPHNHTSINTHTMYIIVKLNNLTLYVKIPEILDAMIDFHKK